MINYDKIEYGDIAVIMVHVSKIDRDGLSVVLRFLPFFGRKRIILFTRDKGNVFDPVDYNIKIHQFIDALYESGFIQPMGWKGWEKAIQKYINFPNLIATADMETLIKILTVHIRKENYKKGHIADMIECGQFEKILTRLKFFKSTPMIKKRVGASRKEEQE